MSCPHIPGSVPSAWGHPSATWTRSVPSISAAVPAPLPHWSLCRLWVFPGPITVFPASFWGGEGCLCPSMRFLRDRILSQAFLRTEEFNSRSVSQSGSPSGCPHLIPRLTRFPALYLLLKKKKKKKRRERMRTRRHSGNARARALLKPAR